MATDFGAEQPGAPLTPGEARAALGGLADDRATLAAAIITPWWYHPALGVITATLVGAHVLPQPFAITAIALAVVAIPLLVATYTRRSGVAVSAPTGPRSRRLLLVTLGILVTAMAASLAVALADFPPALALIPAAVTFVATVALGRRYDDALRRELRAPGDAQR